MTEGKGLKLFFCDTETTGLDPEINGICQASGIVDVGGEVKEKLDQKIAPFFADKLEPKALEVHGWTEKELHTFDHPKEVFSNLKKFLENYVDPYNPKDKFQFVGYNAKFDADFLRQWWRKNGSPYFGSYFWVPPLDVMQLAAFVLRNERSKLVDFKLMTVAKAFGIEIEEGKAHGAMYDVTITRELYYKLIKEEI